jgi:hypothetical protein
LWRRQIVVVKRFRFDFLTRDNIKYFKKEANIFKLLKHDYIIRFLGVVIDPPSLGIVMQYGANGDVFQHLEKKRKEYIAEMHSGKQPSKKVSRRASVTIDKNYVDEDFLNADDIESLATPKSGSDLDVVSVNPIIFSKTNSARDNRVAEDGEERMSTSDIRDRSTIGWGDRSKLIGKSIAQTISSVTNRATTVTMHGGFDPMICAHQVNSNLSSAQILNLCFRWLKAWHIYTAKT